MINYALKEELVYISIENVDFSYRIPLNKIGNTLDWIIGDKGEKGMLFKNVSSWTLQLFTKKITEEKYIEQFQKIVHEFAPKNTINWKTTLLAVNIQNEFNSLISKNKSAEEKMEVNDIVSMLKVKYKLD